MLSAYSRLLTRPAYPDHVIGPNGLLATKARLLATNSLTFLSQFDQLVYLHRGAIRECGTYNALVSDPESEISKIL
jgi:ATP-binding cassette subfamily C (CFTR/MRP) protein 1